jgi:hypothetical protein
MDSGATRAIVLAAFALTAASVLLFSGGQPALFLNGNRLEGLEQLNTSRGVKVPLKEAARLFGARVDPGQGEGFIVEWGKTDSLFVKPDKLAVSDSTQFIDLEFLVRRLGGSLESRNGGLNAKIPPADLLSASASAGEVSLNFSRYAYFVKEAEGDGSLRLKFFNVDKGGVGEKIDLPFGSRRLKNVRLLEGEKGELIVRIQHEKGTTSRIKTSREETGFRFQLDFASSTKVTPALPAATDGQEFNFNRFQLQFSGSRHTLHYLKVSQWRDDYSLLPVVADGELGRGQKLGKLVRDNLGVAGLNANFFDPSSYYPVGLVVKDGKLLSKNWGNRAALGIDYFGRLKFFRPEVDLFLDTTRGRITINGLNRPPGEDELVVYTSEYGKDIPAVSNVTYLKLEEGKVIQRSSGPPGSLAGEEVLVAATGSSRGKLGGLNTGDEAEYNWEMEPLVPLLRGAVSAGPLLIKDGRNALSLAKEDFTRGSSLVQSNARRSVLATTGDGGLLFILISNDGIGLDELPSLLLDAELNIENAIAFDGGSSAGLIYRDGVTMESVGGSRRVPVGLVLVSQS